MDSLKTNDIAIMLTQALIKARSYSGEEQDVVDILSEFMHQNSFDKVFVDRYGNIIGSIYGNQPGPSVLFDGHIDTVPVDDANSWAYNPFGGEIADGKIFGRGASDMKGAVAAMVCTIAAFAKKHGRNFAGSVHFAGVVHEECFEGVAARSVSKIVEPDYVIIGEASELNLKIGQRGRAEIKVETYGKSAHSANPEKGNNAVYQMCRLIEKIQKIVPSESNELGKGILELTDIISYPYPGSSVVPDRCEVTYDRRLLLRETKESVLKPIQEVIDSLEKEDEAFKAEVRYSEGDKECYTEAQIKAVRFFPAWYLDADTSFVQAIKTRQEQLGLNPQISQYNFCTNGSHYAGESDIPTIGFGPSQESLAHIKDEYIEIEQLHKSVIGYRAILEILLETTL